MTTTAPNRDLERRLGPLDAAALIVSNVIGGGILFTPPQIAASVPAALPFLSTWAAGGLLAFAGAMAYAELAALRPRAGGEYVYLREAFGRLAAFLSGWTSFVAGFSGAIATSAVVLASYLGRFIPAASNSAPLVSLPIIPGIVTFTLSPQSIIAVAAIYGMAWIHLRGVGPGRLVGNVLADSESVGVTAVHRLRVQHRPGRRRASDTGRHGRAHRLAAGVDSGDVHLLRVERRVVRRRRGA